MKNLTIKALFLSAMAVSMSAQASYDACVADGDKVIELAKTQGVAAARDYEQKTTVEQCFGELTKIEATYGDKTKGINPYYVMTPADRAKWARLFDSIDAKRYQGVPYLIASYYGTAGKAK